MRKDIGSDYDEDNQFRLILPEETFFGGSSKSNLQTNKKNLN